MNPTVLPVKDAATFAIECRKIRLWIADHDGCTSKEIYLGTGIPSHKHLMKMSGMGIIGVSMQTEPDGRRPQRWFAIPQ